MSEVISNTSSSNWEDTLTNSDAYIKDMLAFYKEGWDARGVDDKKKKTERFKANVGSAIAYIKEVIFILNDKGIQFKSLYFKSETIATFSILISVSLDDYLSKNFLDIYSHTSHIEKSSKSDNFSLNFSFTFDDGSLSEECLVSDGYFNLLKD